MPEPIDATLPLAEIHEPPHQLREEIVAEDLAALADDIAARGLLQPIGVRAEPDRGGYTIGFGHRRYLAVRLLGREEIRARVWPAGADLLEIAIAENHFRSDLNPIEDARAMQQLVDRGEALVMIARRYRCSEGTVRGRLALLELPRDLQQAIARGELSASVAQILGAIDHEAYRASLVEQAIREGTSARIANVWAAHYAAERERLVGNFTTIEALAEQRAAYVPYYACDACRREVPYDQTRNRRFCLPCLEELTAALQEAQRESTQATTP